MSNMPGDPNPFDLFCDGYSDEERNAATAEIKAAIDALIVAVRRHEGMASTDTEPRDLICEYFCTNLYVEPTGNVFDYFQQKMRGRASEDQSLKELEVNSNCGLDCVRAIDAAAAFLECSAMAHGEDADLTDSITRATDHTIQVYWRG